MGHQPIWDGADHSSSIYLPITPRLDRTLENLSRGSDHDLSLLLGPGESVRNTRYLIASRVYCLGRKIGAHYRLNERLATSKCVRQRSTLNGRSDTGAWRLCDCRRKRRQNPPSIIVQSRHVGKLIVPGSTHFLEEILRVAHKTAGAKCRKRPCTNYYYCPGAEFQVFLEYHALFPPTSSSSSSSSMCAAHRVSAAVLPSWQVPADRLHTAVETGRHCT